MRILMIGATGFIGSCVTRDLAALGHRITVFHRGKGRAPLPATVEHIFGDRRNLAQHRPEFERLKPDVVVDCILSSGSQAQVLMDTFRSIAGRAVMLSSQDVYRACGILHGLEPGPLQPAPITEDSDLRTCPQPYPIEAIRKLREIFPWLDEQYDKIPAERAVLGDSTLPGAVLRLPMVYGPGDPLHRLFPILKRIADGRPAILLQEDAAEWRGQRGYVENVAAGIALAVASPQAAGRIYNLGEPEAFSESQWTQRIGEATGWSGRVVAIPREQIPAHLRVPFRSEQHWEVSTRRVRDELGFSEPVPFDAGLARTIAWESANPPAYIDPAQFDYAAEDAALTGSQTVRP